MLNIRKTVDGVSFRFVESVAIMEFIFSKSGVAAESWIFLLEGPNDLISQLIITFFCNALDGVTFSGIEVNGIKPDTYEIIIFRFLADLVKYCLIHQRGSCLARCRRQLGGYNQFGCANQANRRICLYFHDAFYLRIRTCL